MNEISTVGHVVDWYQRVVSAPRNNNPDRPRLWHVFRESMGDLEIREASPRDLLRFVARIKAAVNQVFDAAAYADVIARNPFTPHVRGAGCTSTPADEGE